MDREATAEAGAMKVTVLVDNRAPPELRSEHGFAAWIEVGGKRVLFDTGQGIGLLDNAQKLGVDLAAVDTLVLSHGHYDHTGGVPVVVARAPDADVCAHPAAAAPRYALRGGVARSIGMPSASRAALESHPAGVRWSANPCQIAPDVGLTGPVPRLTDHEDTGGPFFVDAEGDEPDPITDDQALWVRTGRGLVVVVGCCHAGLVNTLRYALKVSGEGRLHAVIGGFHLNEASERRLSRTMSDLRVLDPDVIVPCHCTGEPAIERLGETFGERVVWGSAGAVFRFGGAAS